MSYYDWICPTKSGSDGLRPTMSEQYKKLTAAAGRWPFWVNIWKSDDPCANFDIYKKIYILRWTWIEQSSLWEERRIFFVWIGHIASQPRTYYTTAPSTAHCCERRTNKLNVIIMDVEYILNVNLLWVARRPLFSGYTCICSVCFVFMSFKCILFESTCPLW